MMRVIAPLLLVGLALVGFALLLFCRPIERSEDLPSPSIHSSTDGAMIPPYPHQNKGPIYAEPETDQQFCDRLIGETCKKTARDGVGLQAEAVDPAFSCSCNEDGSVRVYYPPPNVQPRDSTGHIASGPIEYMASGPHNPLYPHEETTAIDCIGAPSQYQAAGSWIDAGHHFKCDSNGEKHYLFYSDAIIQK